MPAKKTTRSVDSAAKAKKAPAAKKAAKKTTKKATKKAATKKAPAAKKAAKSSTVSKFTKSYSLSGVDVTGRNLVIVESPAKGKTIQ